MAEGPSRKRSFDEDDESNKPPPEKRVRFPKGKKVKQGDHVIDGLGEDVPVANPRLAARNRAVVRNKFDVIAEEYTDAETFGFATDLRKAEVNYKEDDAFIEEGVAVEPFNLDKEREEGYFDDDGNYVEYVNQNEIKDAWLDSVDVHEKYVGKRSILTSHDEEPRDLSTEELAEMNRRIACVLDLEKQ